MSDTPLSLFPLASAALQLCRFEDLKSLPQENWREAFALLRTHWKHILEVLPVPELRPAHLCPPLLKEKIRALFSLMPPEDASQTEYLYFLQKYWQPYLITSPPSPSERFPCPFATGYYEPVLQGSLTPTPAFREPLLARPADLITFSAHARPLGPFLEAGRLTMQGHLVPYPDRKAIESGALGALAKPLVFVRDAVEAFLIHVQGSAQIHCDNDTHLYLTYAGRNGHPYRSIGQNLIEKGLFDQDSLTLARLKEWVRAHGQYESDRPSSLEGRRLLQQNPSYIFFSIDSSRTRLQGPIGGANVPLTPFRSIAIDRKIWSYGLPFWFESHVSWRTSYREDFARLLLAQDTGAAIQGPGRLDLFFGSGETAGHRASQLHHSGRLFILLPSLSEETRP